MSLKENILIRDINCSSTLTSTRSDRIFDFVGLAQWIRPVNESHTCTTRHPHAVLAATRVRLVESAPSAPSEPGRCRDLTYVICLPSSCLRRPKETEGTLIPCGFFSHPETLLSVVPDRRLVFYDGSIFPGES